MTIIAIKTGKAIPAQDYHKFKTGDYVYAAYRDQTERNLMQVRGYDTFGQVMVSFVRHQQRKYVPWHLEAERDLEPSCRGAVEETH